MKEYLPGYGKKSPRELIDKIFSREILGGVLVWSGGWQDCGKGTGFGIRYDTGDACWMDGSIYHLRSAIRLLGQS